MTTPNDPTLSLNLSVVQDYSSEMPFLNLQRTARTWLDQNSQPIPVICLPNFDADGWPLAFPSGVTAIRTLWSYSAGDGGYKPSTSYVIKWTGTGTVASYNAASVTSSVANRIVCVSPAANDLFGYQITANPDQVRNVVVVEAALETLYDMGAIFHPGFIAKVGQVRELRFMDWQRTNNNPLINWADRPTRNTYTYATEKGVALEDMVALVNLVGADAYFCMPHGSVEAAVSVGGATSGYNLRPKTFTTSSGSSTVTVKQGYIAYNSNTPVTILVASGTVVGGLTLGGYYKVLSRIDDNSITIDARANASSAATVTENFAGDWCSSFATYVKVNLNSALVALTEYSNETWNPQFQQINWLKGQSQGVWGSSGSDDITQYKAKETVLMGQAWNTVYGGEAATRTKTVIGTQTANPNDIQYAFQDSGHPWKVHEPGTYVVPNTVIDAVAVTSYFFNDTTTDATLCLALATYLDSHTQAQTAAWMNAKQSNAAYSQSIAAVAAQWATLKGHCNTYGVSLILYEGGQHLLIQMNTSGLSAGQQTNVYNFLEYYNESPYMATNYQTLWDAWKPIGNGPFNHYCGIAANASYNAWGLWPNHTDTTPKGTLIDSLNATEASWFGSGGGTHYRPQTVKVAAAEKVTVSVRGGMVVGGTGHEIVAVPGARTDYTRVRNADGSYTLTKTGFSLTISGVEVVQYTGA